MNQNTFLISETQTLSLFKTFYWLENHDFQTITIAT